MGKGFIDKSKAVTYQLVHRPYNEKIMDQDASEMVLKAVHSEKTKDVKAKESSGIFYEDEYDYMQHLKTMGTDPSAVFITAKEPNLQEDVGFDPNMDPELYEALYALDDEAYLTSEDEGDDYFDNLNSKVVKGSRIADKTTKTGYEQEISLYKRDNVQDSDESDNSVDLKDDIRTNFSMSSSAMFRNSNLTLLDNRFEKVLETYLEEEEEESGLEDSERLNEIFDEFLDSTETIGRSHRVIPKRDRLPNTLRDQFQSLDLKDDDCDSNSSVESIKEKIKEEWDCESILSTFSNIYNRPTILKQRNNPKISLKPIKESRREEESEDSGEKGSKDIG